MANTKDLSLANARLKIFVFGEFRTKKTFFAGSFPKPYFFDFDEGLLTLAGKDIDYDTYIGDTFTVMKQLDAKIDALIKMCPYETVVVDSMTYLIDLVVKDNMRVQGKPKGYPEKGDWVPIMANINTLMGRFMLIPCKNFIVTAHQDLKKDEVRGILKIIPSVVGKLSFKLPTRFDFILHSEVISDKGGDKVVLKVIPSPLCATGARVPFKSDWVEPDYQSFINNLKMEEKAV